MEAFRLPPVDASLEKALHILARQTAFTITSCRQADMPIVYASPGFYELTGYSKRHVLGKNCRFLQGPGTSRHSVLEIRSCIQEERGCTVCMLNYKKDGKPFWNQLCIAPVSDDSGIAYYLGIQTNVTGAVLAQQQQQLRSPFQTSVPGPHGGVHSFKGCPEVVESELQEAAELGSKLKRWHSEKLHEPIPAACQPKGPVSCARLPASLLVPLYKLHQSFVLVDSKLPDHPIVHASAGFLELTGRPRDQVVGQNCRFMQGQHTEQGEVQRLRAALQENRPITVRLLNYRHDGTPFWNSLHVAPVRSADGEVVFLVGVQLDVTLLEEPSRDLPRPAGALDPRAKQEQRSVVGTVRVLCRSLSAKAGLRRRLEDQREPRGLPSGREEHKPLPGSQRIGMPTLGSSHI